MFSLVVCYAWKKARGKRENRHMETNVVNEVNELRYETARTKGTFKTKRQTKQIYIHNKTCNDTFKILRWFYIVRKIVLCVCVYVTNTTKTTERVK